MNDYKDFLRSNWTRSVTTSGTTYTLKTPIACCDPLPTSGDLTCATTTSEPNTALTVLYLPIYILLKKALHHLDIQYLNTSIHFLGLFWHRLGYFVWKRHIHSVWLLHWVWNSGKLTEFSETVSYWISRSCYMIYFVFFSWYLLLRQLLYSWKPRRKTELQQKGKKENIEGWQITQLWSPYQKNQAYLITRLKTISQINRTPMSICNIQTEIKENSFFAFVSQYM